MSAFLITDLIELNQKKIAVHINYAFAFVLYKGELRKWGIAKDKELDANLYHEITEKLLPLRAKKRAMHLLESRPYTEHQLREKLILNQYPKAAIDEAIAYVASFHYIDDEQYAVDYMTYYSAYRSTKRMELDLLKKGISKICIERAYQRVVEESGIPDQRMLILKEVQKKHFDIENCDLKQKQKMINMLLRKGFSYEAIRETLDITF